jgi:hypothetical protein
MRNEGAAGGVDGEDKPAPVGRAPLTGASAGMGRELARAAKRGSAA